MQARAWLTPRNLLFLLFVSQWFQGLADFVTVEKDANGVWWFKHNGNYFISMGITFHPSLNSLKNHKNTHTKKGVNHVNNGGWDDGVGGRESSICQAETNNSLCGDTLSFCGVLGYSPYYNYTQQRYKDSPEEWATNTTQRLKAWSLNTVSGWSSTLKSMYLSSHIWPVA